MCKKLLIKTLNFRALFTVIAFAFSVQTFALEDTRCGSISGFEEFIPGQRADSSSENKKPLSFTASDRFLKWKRNDAHLCIMACLVQ